MADGDERETRIMLSLLEKRRRRRGILERRSSQKMQIYSSSMALFNRSSDWLLFICTNNIAQGFPPFSSPLRNRSHKIAAVIITYLLVWYVFRNSCCSTITRTLFSIAHFLICVLQLFLWIGRKKPPPLSIRSIYSHPTNHPFGSSFSDFICSGRKKWSTLPIQRAAKQLMK